MKILVLTLLLPWLSFVSAGVMLETEEEGLRGMPWMSLFGPDAHDPYLDVLRVELAKAGVPLAGEEGQGVPGLVRLRLGALSTGITMSIEVYSKCRTVNGADCIALVWSTTPLGVSATAPSDIEAAVKSAIREQFATELAAAWLKANPPKAPKIQTVRE